MFEFFRRPKKPTTKKRPRKIRAKPRQPEQHVQQHDNFYDIMKKISDLQDQLSRHDSRIYNKLEEHDDFLKTQHHEPMKKAAIEIMNKLYSQPSPVREEVVRIIKSDEEILSIIGDDKKSADEVAQKMGLTREHVSRRISLLTRNGMLVRVQDGRRIQYAKPAEVTTSLA